jgi:hypothetical protein
VSDNPWIDVTDGQGVYARDTVSIRVGRANWAGRADPASGRATFANRDGRWSPDNPTGPYHGQLVRNMPIRFGVETEGDTWLEWTESDDGTDIISTDDASLDITGDIDIRIEIGPTYDPVPVINGGSYHRLASRSAGPAGWRLLMVDTGVLDLLMTWWDSGGSANNSFFSSTGTDLPRSILWTRSALRFTLDVSTGVTEWFTAPTIGGTYTSAGTTGSGATSIGTASTDLVLGALPVPSSIAPYKGRIYAFQVLDGIAGTPVADLDLTVEAPGTTAITDDAGVDWTVGDQGRVTDTQWRIHGEVASWPTRWDITGNDKWVPIEANGLLRRLRQGRGALRSPIRRGIIREQLTTSVVGYWSMEDRGDQHIRRMGPAVGTKTLVLHGGTPNPASNDDFLCSDLIPTLSDDTWITNVDPYPATDQWMVRILFSAPADGSANDTVDWLEVVTSNLIFLVRYDASTGGDLRLLGYNQEGTVVYDSTSVDFNINGRPVRLVVSGEQSGANLEVRLNTTDVTGTIGGFSDTISSAKAGYVRQIRLNKNRDADKLAVGHLTVESVVRAGDLVDDLAAYDGETAVERVRRLCIEEGVDYRIRGDLDDSTRMGPQSVATLSDLLQEVADTDLGALFDAPDRTAVAYRSGAQIRNQADVTFDYSAGEIGGTPRLDRDDQGFANDITVTNWDGSTYRARTLSGPTSVFAPPSGVGRYDTTYDVSVDNPDALASQANARLALQSVDEPRLSELQLGLHLDAIDATLRAQILALSIGDRINVVGLLDDVYPNPLPQIIQGWTETISRFEHWLRLVTTSAAPWDTGVIEGGPTVARYDTAGSELAAGVSTSATSMSVATTLGPLWTTDSGDLPFDVIADKVRVTVTAISGTSSPQTFTVTGATVVRDLASGGDVRLADPTTYAL